MTTSAIVRDRRPDDDAPTLPPRVQFRTPPAMVPIDTESPAVPTLTRGASKHLRGRETRSYGPGDENRLLMDFDADEIARLARDGTLRGVGDPERERELIEQHRAEQFAGAPPPSIIREVRTREQGERVLAERAAAAAERERSLLQRLASTGTDAGNALARTLSRLQSVTDGITLVETTLKGLREERARLIADNDGAHTKRIAKLDVEITRHDGDLSVQREVLDELSQRRDQHREAAKNAALNTTIEACAQLSGTRSRLIADVRRTAAEAIDKLRSLDESLAENAASIWAECNAIAELGGDPVLPSDVTPIADVVSMRAAAVALASLTE